MAEADVVIAGAGIIGLSVAWQLARRTRLSIRVVEKGASLGEGSTGASSAVCRYRYSTDDMLTLARDGIEAYRQWMAFTGLAQPRARFHAEGVLWMPGGDRDWADAEAGRLLRRGIPAESLDDQALAERFPSLSSCTLAPDLATGAPHPCSGGGRCLFENDGGYMDPMDCAEDLLEACRLAGVTVGFGDPAVEVATEGGRIAGVGLASGERLATPCLVNATGPWCQSLNLAAGVELPWELVPTRIQILCLARPAELAGHIPVTVDMASGIYFRTQNRGQQLVVGSVLEQDEREAIAHPDSLDRQPDEAFLQQKLHALHHRLPGLPYRGRVQGYCGLYTMNRDDVHPVVGQAGPEGYWVANGLSGHGFKLAPAIGSMLARAISGQGADFDTDVPVSFFSPEREPIRVDSLSVLA